jgi:hypothetical protein
MRYCKECGAIYTTDGNVCPSCNCKTEEMEIHDEQQELFEHVDIDKARNIQTSLRLDYESACEDVTKAERKLRLALAAREGAGTTLINFCELANVGFVTEDHNEPEDVEDEEDETEPEGIWNGDEFIPKEEFGSFTPGGGPVSDSDPKFLTWTEAIEDPAEPVDPAADVPLVEDDVDPDEIRPVGDGFDG